MTKQFGNLTIKNNPTFLGENYNFVGYSNNKFGVFDAGMVGNRCQEQVNFIGNQFQGRQTNNLYSNTYNPGWRNHLNFSWSNNNNMVAPSFPNNNNLQRQQASPGFQHPPQDRMASADNKLDKFLDAITNKLSSHEENQK